MKKLLLTLAIALMMVLTVGFTACGNKDNSNTSGGAISELDTTREVYGFSAASAGTLISAMNGGSAAQLAAVKGVTYSTVTDEATIADLNNYMMLVESLLGDGNFSMTAGSSDRVEYAVMETVTYKDMLGNTLEYVMYYNETEVIDDDKDETEQELKIEGVMVIDGTDYAIRSEKESESELGETESETEFVVTLGDNKFMSVAQEYEEEGNEVEKSFVYTVYENSNVVERSAFEYESEDNELEIEFSLTKDGATQIFYLEEENGEIVIRVGDRESSAKYRVSIVEDENGTHYEYETAGGKINKERTHK